jgi:alanine racemase
VLTVDLDAIVANWRKLEKTAVPAECGGVIKADAYGCGVEPVARALASAGCKTFFVATLEEARAARAAVPSAAIYVLNGFFQNTGEAYAKIDCRPVIGDLNELAEWDVFCRRTGWNGGAAIHIDTGMHRLGLTVTEAQGLIPRINAGDHGITLVMSHLASAEQLNNPVNVRQLTAFREIASLFTGVPTSLANSSGVYLGAPFQFDLVRPGAALYGVNPTPESDNPMQPVLELKARIVQMRNIERGETVGYGGTWTARRPTRIAVVSAGYADGYFRAASANDGTRGAEVIVAGRRCPVAGRISMDLMAIDITDLPPKAVRRGHMVTLIGEGITVDELAHHFGTIGYEVLTSLGRRYARIYRGGTAEAKTDADATDATAESDAAATPS